MGSGESLPSCCKKAPPLQVQRLTTSTISYNNPSAEAHSSGDTFVCTEWSHVESLLAHLPPDVHASLEDKAFQKKCHQTFREIVGRKKGDTKTMGPAFLEGDQLIEAVHRSIPQSFVQDRLHASDLSKLVLAFDSDADGRIGKHDFDLFCMWVVAMEVMGFFAGTSPFENIVNDTVAENLLIISEFLDPDHILGKCALPTTLCAYFHPDGITLDEFSAQMESAAYVRKRQGKSFQCVALANHGPDDNGLWNVCSDHPVSLQSLDTAWPRLMPMFRALADMVAVPLDQADMVAGHVDLLACNFAANQTGLDCLKMIESQVDARYAASVDATGNVEVGGNWELARGGRNVAPIYFHEHQLHQFTKVMGSHNNFFAADQGNLRLHSAKDKKHSQANPDKILPGGAPVHQKAHPKKPPVRHPPPEVAVEDSFV